MHETESLILGYSSIFIALLVIMLMLAILFYGGFDNLIKQFVTHTPYIKSISTTTNSFYFGQSFYMYFTVANPQNGNFTPAFILDFDSKCISSPIVPNLSFYYYTIPSGDISIINPNSDSTYALNLTVVNNGCQSDSSTITLNLYRFNTATLIDSKSVSFNIVRTLTSST